MGVFVLLSTDLRIGCSAESKIQANEVQIGLTLPHFAVEVCRQRLAPAHLTLTAIAATPYKQHQAVAAGFLDEVVAPEAVDEVLKARVAHLRQLDMTAFAATKLRVRAPHLAALRTAIAMDIEQWGQRTQASI